MATQAAGIFSSAITTAATSGVKKLHFFSTTHRPKSLSFSKTGIRAEKKESAAPAAPVKEAPVGFTPPQLDPNTPSPIFAGSTGGLLRKAQVEEFYVITWNSPKEQIFEMPTGGAAIMREGPNLLKLARKEQCLALGTRLRSKYKITYQFYRVFPNGEVQYLHPKDGVYPEKANAGREGVGLNMRSIGKNVSPIEFRTRRLSINCSFVRLFVSAVAIAVASSVELTIALLANRILSFGSRLLDFANVAVESLSRFTFSSPVTSRLMSL
ncbi:unnamed protein product [Microthlaspi erraticum]|uniref:Photosystem I reaction center subunit II, chloroplastic n=1 Tax=Microthlaspi erraticum TaxID=1685480 RepID=A0A6D2K1I8_9BRAS|nr:unnamed protein product [Microthlaspi erraticum]